MTLEELSSIKRMLVDLRFIQASALVASGLSDTYVGQGEQDRLFKTIEALKQELTRRAKK